MISHRQRSALRGNTSTVGTLSKVLWNWASILLTLSERKPKFNAPCMLLLWNNPWRKSAASSIFAVSEHQVVAILISKKGTNTLYAVPSGGQCGARSVCCCRMTDRKCYGLERLWDLRWRNVGRLATHTVIALFILLPSNSPTRNCNIKSLIKYIILTYMKLYCKQQSLNGLRTWKERKLNTQIAEKI